MIYLTIVNTVLLVYLLVKSFHGSYYISTTKYETFHLKILYGISFTLMRRTNYGANSINGFHFYIPLKNMHKSGVKDDLFDLMRSNNSNRDYTLRAKFSWLKTEKEVLQFKSDYSIVNPSLVNSLVDDFITRNFC